MIKRLVKTLYSNEILSNKVFQVENAILDLEEKIETQPFNFSSILKELVTFLTTQYEYFKFEFSSNVESHPIVLQSLEKFCKHVEKIQQRAVNTSNQDLKILDRLVKKRVNFFEKLKLSSQKDFSWVLFLDVALLEIEVLRIEEVSKRNRRLCRKYLMSLLNEWMNVKNFLKLITNN